MEPTSRVKPSLLKTESPSGHGRPLPRSELELTLKAVAQAAEVPPRWVVVCYRHGLITPVQHPESESWCFDDNAIRLLRRAQHLRTAHRMNLAAIKMVIGLMNEVEQLREDLRFLHSSVR